MKIKSRKVQRVKGANRNRSGVESLELRQLLASGAANVFATFDGVITAPNGTNNLKISILPINFTLAGGSTGKFVLGLEVQQGAGSTIDPTAIKVADSQGNVIAPLYANPDLGNQTQSLEVVQLPLGAYTLTAGAERGTSGAYRLLAFLAGDVNGDHAVTSSDLTALAGMYGTTSSSPKYNVAGDTNLDGQIGAFDYTEGRANLGDSTTITPMSITLGMSPTPVTSSGGVLVTNSPTITLSGMTEPYAAVLLSNGSKATADGAGEYSFANVVINPGPNTLTATATDTFGQSRMSSLSINLDVQPPSINVTVPTPGLITNVNVKILGSITDNLAGVASLTAQLDNALPVAVTLGGGGAFSFSTTLATDGSADGVHTVKLVATDLAGNTSQATSVSFTLDTMAPVISLLTPPQNLLTNTNISITGTAIDALSGLAGLSVKVDNGSSLPVTVDPTGKFTFTTTLPLDGTKDGAHTAQFVATDQAGNPSAAVYNFRLETLAPTTPEFALASDDRLSGNPYVTMHSPVTLVGTTDPGINVVVVGTALSTTSDATTGAFSFSDVSLSQGPNIFTVTATDGAGNSSSFTKSVTLTSLGADITAELSNDTAPGATTNTDGVTMDSTVAGSVSDSLPITSFEAGFDSVALGNYVDITSSIGTDGSFTLNTAAISSIFGSPLTDGAHTLHLVAVDSATSTQFDLKFTLDRVAPSLNVTAPPDNTTTNANVTVTGNATDNLSGLSSLVSQVDGGAPIVVSVDSTGAFSFKTSLALDGTADGKHIVTFLAYDVAGNLSSSVEHFTLKTIPPATPTVVLATTDRENGALLTTQGTSVTLIGTTDPNASLTLVETGATATTTASGSFQFPGVVLALGDNVFHVKASDILGNTSTFQFTVHRDAASASGNQVIFWNQVQLQAIQNDASDPEHASRGLAMVSAAVYDAVNAINGTPAYYVTVNAPAGSSADAAVASSAYTVLSYLFPAQQSSLDSIFMSQIAAMPAGSSRDNGMAVGQTVANAIISMRQNDGSTTYVDYEPTSAPGYWQPTAPAFMVAENPQWADLKPFAMTSDTQFAIGPPPAIGSAEWITIVNQTLSLGSVNSTTRTADETQIARFWNGNSGTVTPPGIWNQIAETAAGMVGNSLAQDARLFAELNVAEADAAIVAWNAKFTYNTWRPIQVAADAAAYGIEPIANWTPLLTTPPFPEYVSGHSTFSGAAAAVLTGILGDNFAFQATSVGFTRSYTSFEQAAQEAGISRIYGGIHFDFSNTAGLTAGSELGTYVLTTFSTSLDKTPPTVTLTGSAATGVIATSTNLNVTGVVSDNLSGVQSLQVQVDNGAFTPIAFDAMGRFTISTNFALDGSGDGSHTLKFVAQDNAENTSPATTLSITLDTKLPTINVATPLPNANVTAASQLTGTVSGTGSAVVAMSYNVDGGTEHPLTYASDGSFGQTLDLAGLSLGQHMINLSATDSAGNVGQSEVTVNLAALPVLTLTNVQPVPNALDVGLTFRPRIEFSRPIDKTTLTPNDFYLSDSTGTVIPATIVPSDDGSYAFLFPTNPMPGASVVKLTVDGSKIKTIDGTNLDAAGNGTAGSVLVQQFRTVNQAAVVGTTLSGILADPGPDLKPSTVDDVKSGPDGVLMTADDIYLHPITGATLYILGQEDIKVLTKADGSFSFSNLPSGDVKLVIDGTTATNPPAGYYFPSMTLDLTLMGGVANTVMGSMGTTEEQAAAGKSLGVYLPRVASTILTPVSMTQPTTIVVPPVAARPP